MLRVGNIDASSLVATLPELRNWSVLAELVGASAPEQDARVDVTVGDLVLSGTVVGAGVHAGHASAFVVGGANGWGTTHVERRPYASASGVRLAEVAEHRAELAGERVVLEEDVPERTLGPSWTRPAGLAIDALDDLGVPWWMAPDGVTHLGTRPAVARAARFGLEDYSHATGRAVLVSPDDAAAAAQPGSALDVDGVHIEVRACTIRATSGRLAIEVQLGAVERLARILEVMQARAKRRAMLAGPHLYRVQLQVEDRVFVQAIQTGDLDLPDQLAIPLSYGLQGCSQQLRLGEEVLVSFQGGDIGHPIVVSWRGGPPVRTALDVVEKLTVGGGSRPVAMGDALSSWAAAAHALLQALASATGVSGAAELSAYNAAAALGWSSEKLETE